MACRAKNEGSLLFFLFLTVVAVLLLLLIAVGSTSMGASVKAVRAQRRWLAIERQVREKKKTKNKNSRPPVVPQRHDADRTDADGEA